MNNIKSVLFLFIFTAFGLSAGAQTLGGSFDSKFKRYVAGAKFSGTPNLSWNVEAWKGERVSRQIVLWTSGDLTNLNLTATDLTGSGGTIPASAVWFRYGKYIKGDQLAKDCGGYSSRTGYVQLIDALSDEAVTSLSAAEPLKMWVFVQVPPGTPSGTYTGSILATGGTGGRVELKINLTVDGLTLPDAGQWQFHLDLWQFPTRVLQFHNDNSASKIALWSDEHFALLEPFYRALADCGQKVVTAQIKENALGMPSMVRWIRKTDGSWDYDFTAFDRYVSKLAEWGIDGQINCFSPIGWNENEIPYYDEAAQAAAILQASLGSAVYKDRWDNFLTAFKSHLDTKGWFGKTVLYFDEVPEEKVLPVIDQVIIPNNPNWKVGGAVTYDFSVAAKSRFYEMSGLLGRQYDISSFGNGRNFSFYTSCTQLFPNSYVTRDNSTAEMSWMGWHAANKNYAGYLRWAYDNWQLNDPADARDRGNTAGDFSIVYRSANTGAVRCYPSLRLAMLREGIQDFEKIRILRAVYQNNGADNLQMLDAALQKFTDASGENAETLVEQGQQTLAALSRNFTLGIDAPTQSHENIRIYPDLEADRIRLVIPGQQEVADIRFFSLSGAEIRLSAGQPAENGVYSYPVDTLSAGVYYVRVTTERTTYTGAFIVKK